MKDWSRRGTLPLRLLQVLLPGAMEREDFYTYAKGIYAAAGRKSLPYQRIDQMIDEGLITMQVCLTDKGREKLGAGKK